MLVMALFAALDVLGQEPVLDRDDEVYLEPLPIRRLALVIGVQNYRYLDKVENALNDAERVADSLRAVGFGYVRVLRDPPTKEDVIDALAELMQLLVRDPSPATIVVYFAGHGFQVGGKNYVVPALAAKAAGPTYGAKRNVGRNPLVAESIEMGLLTGILGAQRTGGVTILFIDACRSDLINGKQATKEDRGFSKAHDPRNAILSFATEHENLATSRGRWVRDNSPYAAALQQLLPVPSQRLTDFLAQVNRYVLRDTISEQNTESRNEFKAPRFMFVYANEDLADEAAYWKRTLATKNGDCVDKYLSYYPDGHLVQQALLWLERLKPKIGERWENDCPTPRP